MSRTCAFCEYFDGGGLAKVERARRTGESLGGDCLNRQSPRFETAATDTCEHFYPDTGSSPADDPVLPEGTCETCRGLGQVGHQLDACPDCGGTGSALPPKPEKDPAAVVLGRRGGKARAAKLTPERRREIARMGAAARHGKARE